MRARGEVARWWRVPPAYASRDAVRQLRVEAQEGRLDRDAVDAVQHVAGQDSPGRMMQRRATDLTHRQVEVLRLVAAGRSNGEVADALSISRRTAEHHVQDIYVKIGASTRAAAALYAMEHGLVGPRPPVDR